MQRPTSVPEPTAPDESNTAAPSQQPALTWSGGCAQPSEVQDRVDALLGESAAAQYTASATATQGSQGVDVVVDVVGPRGEQRRRFAAPDCETAVEAAALVIAVGVDALAVAGAEAVTAALRPRKPDPAPRPPAARVQDEPPPSAQPAENQPSEADPPARSEPATVSPRRDRSAASGLGLSGLAIVESGPTIGIVPGLGAVLRIGGGLRWRWLSVELLAARHFSKEAALVQPGARVDVGVWSGVVRARGEAAWRTLRFPIALGVSLGDMIGTGRGLDGARTAHALWGAAQLGAGIAWLPVRWIALGLSPHLNLSFARPEFGGVTPTGTRVVAYQTPVAGFMGLATLEVRFP